MSYVQATKAYAVDVAEASTNAFNKQARGDIEAPGANENVRLFTAKGGSAVTLSSATTSASIVFDPEASLRNGQLHVNVFERNAAGSCVAVQTTSLGRPSSEFLSCGVLSSGLKVFNSSGVDVIGGTQSSAVLTSIPKDLSTITSTDLSNSCANHERDLISGVVSREDSTMTTTFSNHFGQKMALCRTDTEANVVKRIWDEARGSRRSTVGESLSFTIPTDMNVPDSGTLTTVQIAAELAASPTYIGGSTPATGGRVFLDTARLTAANNPLTLATYTVDVNAYLQFQNASGDVPAYFLSARVYAMDAAGTIVDTSNVDDRVNVDSQAFDASFRCTLKSSSTPIARVAAVAVYNNSNMTTDLVSNGQTHMVVTAYEETADVPARPIHVTVLEGLNLGATLNLSSFAVLTGVPDATNVFISPSTTSTESVYDDNAVEMFLKSVSRSMPRAFTIAGQESTGRQLQALYGDEKLEVAFKAMSFSEVGSELKRIGKYAKRGTKELMHVMRELEPLMDRGSAMAGLPGPAGVIGSGMAVGAELSRMSRR
uniref:Uncharacterized protein n=1 Tax=viral metagenome TaxID=1070528 RepID=A0A2V0RAP0_9ZZZZ